MSARKQIRENGRRRAASRTGRRDRQYDHAGTQADAWQLGHIKDAAVPPSASETGVSGAVLKYSPGHDSSPDVPMHVTE